MPVPLGVSRTLSITYFIEFVSSQPKVKVYPFVTLGQAWPKKLHQGYIGLG